nr:hypothetical protein [Tanacetum cinerariifolium]
MLDKAFKRVNTFKDFRPELVQGQDKEKRSREDLTQKSAKKLKVDDDKEKVELKQLMKIIPDEKEVAIDAIPLAVKSPRIVDWKIYKEGKKSYYQIIRADEKSKIVSTADRTVKYPKGIAKNVLVRIAKFVFPVDFINLDMPVDIKVPLILERPFLSTSRAKIDVYKRNITLRVEEEKVVFISVKPASSLIKKVYMLSLRERMELDLEARLMGETLVLNRSLDPFFEDYIKLNDLNEPIELRRNQDKMVYKGDNVVGALTNVPIFVGNFYVMTDFIVLESMDAYRDYGMGDIIVGKPFLREVRIKARWFEGIIILYMDDKSVTYQMVSDEDMMNGILHPYQKLKGFYKGVLILGPNYIQDVRMEEWLIRA